MSNSFGNRLKITIFGQSHAPSVGCVIEGFPAGFAVDMEALGRFLARRAPGRSLLATGRREADAPRVMAGLVGGQTCGAPIMILFENADVRSGDYKELKNVPRPGHSDYPAHVKYRGFHDVRGGGAFSGRLTLPLCAAGGCACSGCARGRRGRRAHRVGRRRRGYALSRNPRRTDARIPPPKRPFPCSTTRGAKPCRR